ncbi:hypothetical protein [Clostridioides difficile]|nr:hypothetical protein [Clostridioides difficile]
MKKICEDEGIDIDDKALNLIARNSQGALRDALSILDQCMSFGESKIDYKDVVELMGSVNIEQLFELSQCIVEQDTKKSLEILNEFVLWGKDIRNLINDLIDHFRNLMVCKVSSELDEIISLPEETIEQLKIQSKNIDINDLIRILNILSITQDDIKSSSNPRVLVEITIMKIAQPMFDESKEALIKRVENLEKMIELGNFKSEKIGNNKEKEYEVDREIDVKQENVVYEDVKNEDVILIESSWKNILKQIKKDKKMPIYALLSEVKSFNVYSNMLYVIFDDKFDFAKTRLSSQDTINYLEKTIRDVLNRSFNVKIVLTSEVKDINLEVKEKKDIGEEILKNIVSEEILEIKDSIDENESK